MDPRITPVKLNLKRDERLDIQWQDGHASTFPLAFLRKHCPCASCKAFAEEQAKKPKTSLTVINKPIEGALTATHAELVGGYAIRIDWSDDHSSGIYSFQYLRDLDSR
jgi:DUF971 family protein